MCWGAAAELDLFSAIGQNRDVERGVGREAQGDLRATTILLDGLVALSLLSKQDQQYQIPDELRPLLVEGTPQSILPMIRHNMSLVRTWSQLARIAKTGEPAVRQASIRGAEADRAAFIAAMHTVSGPIADELVARLGPPRFQNGCSTWAEPRALGHLPCCVRRPTRMPRSSLPDAIEQARQRIAESGLRDRVSFVAPAISIAMHCRRRRPGLAQRHRAHSILASTTASCSRRRTPRWRLVDVS